MKRICAYNYNKFQYHRLDSAGGTALHVGRKERSLEQSMAQPVKPPFMMQHPT